MSDAHANYRDEQFWFTAAVVGFNTLIIAKNAEALPAYFLIVASGVVSLFGAHLMASPVPLSRRTSFAPRA
jgi:hypothetical protein